MKPIIFLTIIFSSFLGLYSQNETGIRTGNLKNIRYFNPRVNLYPLQVPIIPKIPPIDSLMPFEVSLAYTVIDSLAKLITTNQAIAYINTLSWNSDTMKTIFRYMYLLENYDFIRFTQYMYETKYNQLGQYKANLEEIRRYILSKYKQDNMPDMKKNMLFLVLKLSF